MNPGLTLKISEIEDLPVLTLLGRMDAANHDQFDTIADRLVAAGHLVVAVDLTDLTYISSAGTESLRRLTSSLRERGGSVCLCGVSGVVKTVLEITRVLPLFQLFDAPETAHAATRPTP